MPPVSEVFMIVNVGAFGFAFPDIFLSTVLLFKNDGIESIPAAGEIKACLGKAW